MPARPGPALLASLLAPLLAPALALGVAALLGGCAALNPAEWFHQQEGGVIAQQKGPLPGENKPYPNLATVPPPPSPPDLAALQHITNGLIADRQHAHLMAEAAPLPDPSRPSTAPALFGVGSLPPPAPPPPSAAVASASMPAVTTPAAAPPPPAESARPAAKAPVAPVQSTPLPPPPATASPHGAATQTSGPTPAIPAAPPPPPKLAQAGLPAAPPTAAPPTPAPPAPPATPGPAADRVVVPFAPGSADVPPVARAGLRALAARRGSRMIEALGQGDAASADAAAQLAAVKLGLARAQAIAAALEAAGVPASAIQVRSDASGHGGIARLR